MLEKEYKVRASVIEDKKGRGKEITLPPDWCRYHRIETGDVVKVLANGIMILLPPHTSVNKEAKIRAFLERGM